MDRRSFLGLGLGAVAGAATYAGFNHATYHGAHASAHDLYLPAPPAHAVVPVVGDGKWVWVDPPTDQTGYLEPRQFALSIGVTLRGNGPATEVKAATTAPTEMLEQKIDEAQIDSEGCEGTFRQLAPEAGQLYLYAPTIEAGQTISAVARYRLTLSKQYWGYSADQFPATQDLAKFTDRQFRAQYLSDSPGIQWHRKEVGELARHVAGSLQHPWDIAHAFFNWVRTEIVGRPGKYTSVTTALRDRVGDCEERAAVFVAFCRAVGIPARLVWVPNHNWAEFYLHDEQGIGHWIPAHTSCYSWFGWSGAHELVLQKGDNIQLPEKRKTVRLLADWLYCLGTRPSYLFTAEIKPLASKQDEDPGPGERRKNEKGEWVVVGHHPLDAYLRDGSRAVELAKGTPTQAPAEASHAGTKGKRKARPAARRSSTD